MTQTTRPSERDYYLKLDLRGEGLTGSVEMEFVSLLLVRPSSAWRAGTFTTHYQLLLRST
jgi:hypothetical protein